jgi:ElaB/YqjD/DUF883 family membrane-anchored ribosome-binding protein
MNTTTTIKQVGSEASSVADQAADSVNSAVRSTQGVANQAFDRLSDKIESAREQAVPLINRLTSQAENAAHRGADAVRDVSAQVRDRALKASDTTVSYIKDEPVKAMLIAAATGAALMALIGLLSRSRRVD